MPESLRSASTTTPESDELFYVPFPIGSYVYFYRVQASAPQQSRGQGRNYRWFGPARVIGAESRNQHRAEDPEPATEGGQPHAYWLRYGPSVILVTGEQLKFASEDELLATFDP